MYMATYIYIWILGYVDRREDRNCRIGSFPKPKQAIWEAPEALRPPHIVPVWMRRMWVFPPGEIRSVRKVGVSPGETQDARYVGVSQGERTVARKTGIPRARRIVNEICIGL